MAPYNLKKLFGKTQSHKIISSASVESVGLEAGESSGFVDSSVAQKQRFFPHVDYSDPANFVKFGSAKQYYLDAATRIYSEYPYDGSRKEKIDWHNSSSYFDNYIFDKEYPRRTGYANFSHGGWGTQTDVISSIGKPSIVEFIQFKGGPHADENEEYIKSTSKANIYDVSKNRESNLDLDGNKGVTIEFWLRKDGTINNNLSSGDIYPNQRCRKKFFLF